MVLHGSHSKLTSKSSFCFLIDEEAKQRNSAFDKKTSDEARDIKKLHSIHIPPSSSEHKTSHDDNKASKIGPIQKKSQYHSHKNSTQTAPRSNTRYQSYDNPFASFTQAYPSMTDNSCELYSYQCSEKDASGEVELLSLPGLEDVTTDNIDRVKVAYRPPYAASRLSYSDMSSCADIGSNYTSGAHQRRHHNHNKRSHTAMQAASWYTSTFNQPPEKVHKTEENYDTKLQSITEITRQESEARWASPEIKPTAQPELSAKPMIILKQRETVAKSQPRFVPRQLSSQVNAAAMKAHETVVENSTKLGKVQEATLPKHIEMEIRAGSGQTVADETTLSIREKIRKVC